MPIIKSAIKRVRTTERRRKRNLLTKRRYRDAVKTFLTLVEEGNKADATKLFPEVQKCLDLAVKKNVLHKKTAARRKSRFSKMISDKA